MYNNKKLNIKNFDTITGLVIRNRWEAAYQGHSDDLYRFDFIDNNTSWNYPFIEMELDRKIVGTSCQLKMTYYTSPTTNPYSMMTWIQLCDLQKGALLAVNLVKIFDRHFM